MYGRWRPDPAGHRAAAEAVLGAVSLAALAAADTMPGVAHVPRPEYLREHGKFSFVVSPPGYGLGGGAGGAGAPFECVPL